MASKDDNARRFYLEYGFLEFPHRPLNLFLPIARVREATVRPKR